MGILENLFNRKLTGEFNSQTSSISNELFVYSSGSGEIFSFDASQITDIPEVALCLDAIAGAASQVSIGLWMNSDKGDIRIKDGLSRLVDISPNQLQTRQELIYSTVYDLVLYGNSLWLPIYKKGKKGDYLLDELLYVNWPDVVPTTKKGEICYLINGKYYEKDEVIHFRIGDKKGVKPKLVETARGLSSSLKSMNLFMNNNKTPSLAVSVDSDVAPIQQSQSVPRFSTKIGELNTNDCGEVNENNENPNQRFENSINNKFISTVENGGVLVLPGRMMKLEQIKPISLKDTGLNDAIKTYREAVSLIFKVPAYLLKLEKYDGEEWDNFISLVVSPLLNEICQRLTKEILIDPNRYFKPSTKSLLSFNFDRRAVTILNLVNNGLLTKNEGRESLQFSRFDDSAADELVQLENYKNISHSPTLAKTDDGGFI